MPKSTVYAYSAVKAEWAVVIVMDLRFYMLFLGFTPYLSLDIQSCSYYTREIVLFLSRQREVYYNIDPEGVIHK